MSLGLSRGGALLVDKPAGPSSHDVVARVRKLFHIRAVGHTGTLDPFATGLLVLVLGPATRLARWVERRPKTYLATARLGQVTDTDDPTGSILEERVPDRWPVRAALEAGLARSVGTFEQQPPRYSAKQVGGVRSYRAARGDREPLPLTPVRVTVHTIELVEYAPPLVTFRAEVGPGTYLRALARDLGHTLGTGAHLTALRRERIGPWGVEAAHRFEALSGSETLLSPESLVDELGRILLSPDEARLVRHGQDIERPERAQGEEAGLYERDRLVAIARRVDGGWHPAVVLPKGDGLEGEIRSGGGGTP